MPPRLVPHLDRLAGETRLSASAAARLSCGRAGKGVVASTVRRWIERGVLGPDRVTRVRLEAVRQGGVWVTSVEALDRFLAALNDPLPIPPRRPSSAQARARYAQADAEARAMGI